MHRPEATCSSQTPCTGRQSANWSCLRKPDNKVRKIAFQSLFNLISNFRHRWFFQSMVISIIDDRNKRRRENPRSEILRELPHFLIYICPETVTDPTHSLGPHSPALPGLLDAGCCRSQTLHQKGAQHRLWRKADGGRGRGRCPWGKQLLILAWSESEVFE